MVLPLIAMAAAQGASMYMDSRAAQKRKRALEGIADQERQLADWQINEGNRLSSQEIARYGDLSRERSAQMDAMLRGYTAPVADAPTQAVTGDPRFDLATAGDVGDNGVGSSWAAGARAPIQRSQALQDVVRSNDMRNATEQVQRGEASAGMQQGASRLGVAARDYGDIAAIRRQAMQNELLQRVAALEAAGGKAAQAGNEQLMYGGLARLGGQAIASYGSTGKPASTSTAPTVTNPALNYFSRYDREALA
jgi:hypothetical protein